MIEKKIFKRNRSSHILILCGGDGDTKETFEIVSTELSEKDDLNVCTFTYNTEGFKSVDDLREIIIELKKSDYVSFDLLGTSMGSICTTMVALEGNFNIKNVIYLDPADYYINAKDRESSPDMWDGNTEYEPQYETLSNQVGLINDSTQIHVINFLLRNCRNGQYVNEDLSKRGIDYEDGHSRLNNEMVKSFYTNAMNKGLYIEDQTLPHGLFVSGNIEENNRKVVDIISECLI